MDDETELQALILADRHIHEAVWRIRKQRALLTIIHSDEQRKVGAVLLAALYDGLRVEIGHRRLIRHTWFTRHPPGQNSQQYET
ncbi:MULTISPECIES: hypothetical protein [Paraburkholderia]|uniref:N-acetyltransferase domain-containing protein n=1 Tax=Paraburkholderia ferrariae TaxID=386056 RepID=A0ABU9S0W1_9BURK|nr:hypothetical protein [Paraburkholderia nodosa]